jgi:hypothetical protein
LARIIGSTVLTATAFLLFRLRFSDEHAKFPLLLRVRS